MKVTAKNIAKLVNKMKQPLKPNEARYVRPGGIFDGQVRSRLSEEEFNLLISLAPPLESFCRQALPKPRGKCNK